jgi:ferric-dicitrate binding protein FerR (iron transport regulator)
LKETNKPYRIPKFLLHTDEGKKPLSSDDINEIEHILNVSEGYQFTPNDIDLKWNSFASQIATPMQVVKKPLRFAMFRWVAAAVVILTFGIGVWQFYDNKANTFTAVYTTQLNSEFVKLPDGSEVLLNKGTELEVVAINKHRRVLRLKSGEAFFKVIHNNLPFRVLTDEGQVSVMGTEFIVKNRIDRPFSLYLKSGKIEFQSGDEKVVLKPGDYLEEEHSGDFSIHAITDTRATAWMDGKLSFDNTYLSEIISGLESVYQVKFNYDKTLAAEKLTISFDDLSAIQAAELLSKTMNSSFELVDYRQE